MIYTYSSISNTISVVVVGVFVDRFLLVLVGLLQIVQQIVHQGI